MLHLFEYSPIAQFAISMDHEITVWNKACELLTGMTADEMIGTDRQWEAFYDHKRPVVADLIVDNNFEQFLHLYADKDPALSKIVPNAWEASSFFPDLGGRPRYAYFLAAPILDNEGRMIGAVETLQDITEQKQLEQLIREETNILRKENLNLKSAISERYRFGEIIGKSQAMQEVYELIARAAANDSNVIVYGESGTGKELVAKAIHDMSDRRANKFVPVNCGAIPETLIESEFFGSRKGAFTGAENDKFGHLGNADGGTLFLDEVGELNLNMQAKLLRAIEGGGHSPLGSSEVIKPDIRIIAATNRDLTEHLSKGRLREDFFYRIHVIPIHLPPLRERKEDLPLLVDHFLSRFSPSERPPTLPGKVFEALHRYDWPGNVRELQNVLHRYVALKKLDFTRTGNNTKASFIPKEISNEEFNSTPAGNNLRQALEQYEKRIILKTLEHTHWHRTRAAEAIGVSRKTLFRKMKHYGL